MANINTISTPMTAALLPTYEWRNAACTTGELGAFHAPTSSVVPAAAAADSVARMGAGLSGSAVRRDKQVAKPARPPRGRTP